jgi:arylsulfatase A-like enzyme
VKIPPKRFLLFSALAAALWGLVALLIIPALIRGAYAGNSVFTPLNGVIKGQAAHPVAYYLGLWYRAAGALTLGGLAAVALGLVLWPYAKPFTAFVRRALRSEPVVGLLATVLIATCIGFAGGLAETLSLALRFLFNPDPREAPPIDALWMAPLATALLGALMGLLLGVILRAWRGLSIAVPVVLFAGFAVFSVLRVVKIGLHPYAAMILAAGIAVELARQSRHHGRVVTVFARRAIPWLAATTLVGAMVIHGVMWARERSALASAGAAPRGAPNVLLLILDTVRAANLGLYGYDRKTTPEIERIAATGVTFDRAFVSAPWTLPSHASIFTGLPPHKLSTDFDRPLDGAAPTLAEVLLRRGYATGGFVANPTYASRASGLNRGFATYRDHSISFGELLDNARWTRLLAAPIREAFGERGRLVRKSAEDVNREILDWVPTDGRPFFAFLNYFDAHEPYETHPPFELQFSDHPPKFWLIKGWQSRKNKDELQELRNAYDSNIAYIDHYIGALIRELDKRGVLKNTIVIVASDHGEHLGEHGGIMSHANSLYMPLLHVPLVISFPPRVPAAQRVSQPVSLQNIAATVLDILAVPPDVTLPGTSLARLWSAPGDTTQRDTTTTPAILSELTYNTFSSALDPIQKGPMHSIIRDNLHYIRNGDGSEELYDFEADPRERDDLARAEGVEPRLPELRRAMDEMLGERARAPGPPRATKRKGARAKVRQ